MKSYFLIFFNIFKVIKFKLLNKKIKISWIQQFGFFNKFYFKCNCYVKIGRHLITEKNCIFFVDKNANLQIGNNIYFNRNLILSCKNKVLIGDYCIFGPDVKIYDNNHKFKKNFGISFSDYNTGDVVIGKNCWIGANVIILKDTYIGDNCVIGAGCIVSGKISDNSIVTMDRKLKIENLK